MTTAPRPDGTWTLALIDRLIALRGADVGEIGRVLSVTLRPVFPRHPRNTDREAAFPSGHVLSRVELRRDTEHPERRGLVILNLSERVCLRRGDLDRHFAARPIPQPISPPPWTPGMPLTPHPGDWMTWSYEQEWGSVGVQYVSFEDRSSPRRDCVQILSLNWPPLGRPERSP